MPRVIVISSSARRRWDKQRIVEAGYWGPTGRDGIGWQSFHLAPRPDGHDADLPASVANHRRSEGCRSVDKSAPTMSDGHPEQLPQGCPGDGSFADADQRSPAEQSYSIFMQIDFSYRVVSAQLRLS
jgi:hypothetical protein